MPGLYIRRRRLRARAEAEARGETFWTTSFSDQLRTKILYAAEEAAGGLLNDVFQMARYLLLKDQGARHLIQENYNPVADLYDYISSGPDEGMPDVIEAVYQALRQQGAMIGPSYVNRVPHDEFASQVREILEEHRVSFALTNGEMIPFESKELFRGVIEPAIQLLHDARFKAAEAAYHDALEEVGKGKAGDAITDASTALQEMLVALGCSGGSLGPLIKSARSRGLLAAHDERLTKAITDVAEWIAADRTATGDAHKADHATKADAWFMIHVVGSLIARLSEGRRT